MLVYHLVRIRTLPLAYSETIFIKHILVNTKFIKKFIIIHIARIKVYKVQMTHILNKRG